MLATWPELMPPCDPHADAGSVALLDGLRRLGESDTFLFGHQNTGWSNQNAQSRVVESSLPVANMKASRAGQHELT